jgi:hypothetical protein
VERVREVRGMMRDIERLRHDLKALREEEAGNEPRCPEVQLPA